MLSPHLLKIDAYAHIIPPKFKEVLYKIAPDQVMQKIQPIRSLYDLSFRFHIMDKYQPIRQVLTLAWPPLEDVAGPEKAAELAMLANDEMAELVAKYPDRFIAALATLPMNNIGAALKEINRALDDLRFKGIYIHTPANNQPLDSPEFWPIYEKLADYDLPVLIHPMRGIDRADYIAEKTSKYRIYGMFGWPYETTVAMARLVCSGTLARYPGLKVLTHHGGGMVPYFAERIIQFTQQSVPPVPPDEYQYLNKDVIDYFKMFYADTAIYGNPTALTCCCEFFGLSHVLFGADFPLGDTAHGDRNYRQTINAITNLPFTEEEKQMIFANNAIKLMRLPA